MAQGIEANMRRGERRKRTRALREEVQRKTRAERGESADLPELDNLHCHKQRDGHQVGVQDPEGDQVDEEL